MPHDPEQKRLAGQKGRKHGVYSLEERGEAAMTTEQRQTFSEIKASLEAPEGIVTALRERVAMGLVVVGVIERYAEEQHIAGKTPDDIPILKAWPAFQNSVIRALKQLMDTMPDDRDRAEFAELVGEMTERVEKSNADTGELSQQAFR